MTAMWELLRNASKDMLRDVLSHLEREGASLGHFNVTDQVLASLA